MTEKVTCGLTACTPGSALGPMLDNEYGKTQLLLLTLVRSDTVLYCAVLYANFYVILM